MVLVCWTHECKTEASTFFTTMYDMCSFQRGNFAQWYRCLACGRRREGGGAPLLTCNAGSRSSVHFPRSRRYTFSFHQRAAQTIIPKGSIQAAIKCFWVRPQPAKQESSCVRPSLPSPLVCVLKVYRGHCAVYIMHGSKSMMSSFWRVELTQLGVFLLETGGQEYEMWMAAVRLQSNLRVQLLHLQPRWSQETSAYENHEYSLLSLRMKCYFIKVGVAQRGRVSAHTSGTLCAQNPLCLLTKLWCVFSPTFSCIGQGRHPSRPARHFAWREIRSRRLSVGVNDPNLTLDVFLRSRVEASPETCWCLLFHCCTCRVLEVTKNGGWMFVVLKRIFHR